MADRTQSETTKTAIEHYDRMINWAKEQNPNGYQLIGIMLNQLGECYGSKNCAFCQSYGHNICGCNDCPLYCRSINSYISNSCCAGLWENMATTETWGEFIPAAEKVREYIREQGGE